MHTSTSYPTLPHRPERAGGAPLAVWLARVAIAAGFMLAVSLALALMIAAAYGLRYRGLIYPGVSAWGVDLSGMPADEAAMRLSSAFSYPSSPAVVFRDGDEPGARAWTATPAQLGLTYDLPATVNAAYRVGRSGNLLADALAQFDAWYTGRQVSPVAVYSEQQTTIFLNNVAQEVNRPAVEASLTAEGTTITATPGQIGRQLDVAATAAQVREPLLALGSAQIPLVIIETSPQVLDASAQAEAARALVSQPLTLFLETPLEGDPGPWVIEPAALGEMLQVRRVEDAPNAAHFEVGLDEAALRAALEPLREPLKQTAVNARFIFNDDTRLLERQSSARAGRDLNIESTIARINTALAAGQHRVAVALDVTPPEVPDDATAEKLGITEVVSEQSTYFGGSGAERVRNIQVAAARFHGLLIAPGATFSFVEYLGDVSLDTGFAEALIIYGGRTIRGVGGGVCQVSTTVFRAAYFGGYPIVERYPHAYRVSYYEKGDTWRGPGLDATVYAPLVDFKFQNDTPYWLLMETYVSPNAGRITWKFYSTSDGRQTTVSAPEVRNVVPAPEPLYEEDPALPKGEIKQVDWAADGADVTVYRTITRDGAQVNGSEPPMATNYQPWRAVYHYGPGTEGIPAPTPSPTPTPTP